MSIATPDEARRHGWRAAMTAWVRNDVRRFRRLRRMGNYMKEEASRYRWAAMIHANATLESHEA